MGDPFAAASAPRREPLTYPGVWPDSSVVIAADRMWEINDRDGYQLAWTQTAPVRLGVCRVRDLSVADHVDTAALQLGRLAEQLHYAAIDNRTPVLAIGSNASPAQLRHKFAGRPEALFIPQLRARVTGARVGYMPLMTQFGYVAATIHPEPGSTTTLAVQLLDDAQLDELDRSETGYRRVWLDARHGVSVELETGERLPGVYAYVAPGGVLLGADGEPIPMTVPGQAQQAPGALTQKELQRALKRDSALLENVGENPFFGTEADDEMGRPTAHRYGSLERPADIAAFGSAGPGEMLAWADGSPDGLRRGGKSVLRLNRADLAGLGNPKVVALRSAALYAQHGEKTPSALAAVHPYDPADPPEPAPGEAQIDQVLRIACGIERGDPVAIRPAHVRRARSMDWLLGKPTYLTMRVTLADTATAERDVVLMPRLAIDVLGIESGDYVVLEGNPGPSGEVPSVVLKVFEVPSEVEDMRRTITGGSWGARFPAANETLGVSHELPLAFIDAELRTRLGVTGQTLPTVRARPGRLHRFYAELREILLVLAVALLGVVTVVNDAAVQIGLIAALVVLSMVLVFGRMRRRLSHRTRWRGRAGPRR
ncbi:MAG: gamma-glutamylcyclotransferase family protein [Gordonia sp. (in: high G+C Gram-positive bacteria)]|uniref:gamma-glutamylcyclotransferase family protein n=1 Tax=Gordonia sp. (in: high G+C Gram-positive bacteria) TaxID=84139 RepID=UPI0039E6E85A